jgi:hypothetical protein
MCGAPERLLAFGARTFATVITTSVFQDWRCLYDALIIHCVARIVAAPSESRLLAIVIYKALSRPIFAIIIAKSKLTIDQGGIDC